MQKEMSPVVMWVVIGVVAVAVIAVGFKFLGGGGSGAVQKTGSETSIKQFQQTGTFYTPPPGAPTGAGANGGAPNAVPTGPPGTR